jgi:hypothetical protein
MTCVIIMLSVVMVGVIMLRVVKLSVVMLSVVAPLNEALCNRSAFDDGFN